MAKEDLSERLLSREEIFSGRLLQVRRDTVRMPDGATATREYIVHPGAVAVLAFTDAGEVVLERQFRYPHGRDFIEIPAGKVERGEDLLESARRELLEETGYVAREWERITTIHNAISYSDEAIELFVARGLEKRQQALDAEEFLEVLLVPFGQAIDMVKSGHITDVKTMIALFWAQSFLPGQS